MNIIGLQTIHCPAVHVYMHERVQGTKYQQKASSTLDLSIPAEKARNHAAQSGLVQQHHLHPRQERLCVSSGNQ